MSKTITIPGPFSKKQHFCKLGHFKCCHLDKDDKYAAGTYCTNPDALILSIDKDFVTPPECPLIKEQP